ncbi:MAG: thioredoxin family protein [Planctomycetota bacterium]|nr:thioredoxin family protein [Planctomycetota bacterium]
MRNQVISKRPFVSAGVFAACAAAVLAAGGCGTQGKLANIPNQAEFQRQVVESKTPVLVDFYKDNCPTCVVQEAALESIYDEFNGKVTMVKFKIREATMAGAAPEIMDRYKLFWVPTMILFVNGQEKQRWVFNHGEQEIREVLNKVVAGAPLPQNTTPQSTATPGTGTAAAGAAGASDGEMEMKCIPGKGCRLERKAPAN